jgi:hypothetical protein
MMLRMTALEDATSVLRDTEKKLRQMVSSAATSGDYASVMKIASWAQAVTSLLNGQFARTIQKAGSKLPQNNPKGAKEPTFQTRGSRRPGTEYPQFFRHSDQLVRLAWSRGQRKEYAHKASYQVLKSLTKAMAERGAEGRVFSTEGFLPLHDSTSGDEIPNYQAYVCISLFKQSGLIDQHGRQGYSIPRLADFKDAVEAVWKKLPER